MGRDTLTDKERPPPALPCSCCGKPGRVYWRQSQTRWERSTKCVDCRRAVSRAYDRSDVGRDGALRRRYGITLREYEARQAEQGGTCAICKRKCASGNRLSVDHNHDTGAVRGLLCRPCNKALGIFQDDPDLLRAATRYLRRSTCPA